MNKKLSVEYTIVQCPSHITVTCPHCEEEFTLSLEEAESRVGDIFDPIGDIECPECKEEFEVSGWELD
ncbi:hypothetical protein HB904_16885 [Listeria booriae]|uniref:Uncharacterized protein n=1 Tax=Listeria booriae TaxID=1552123 RepID=A0A841YPR7_9LIST|nr:hypothetical protein [Listeria booriae]MBC1402123.1 hypothetical protein [Listeria booriae]MBC1617855.1 hypothetical protein [Listeria booriae]